MYEKILYSNFIANIFGDIAKNLHQKRCTVYHAGKDRTAQFTDNNLSK